MARYFKFHTLEDLAAECRRLGVDMPLDEDLSPLFQPVTVGSWTVGNAMCVQPMEGCDGTITGEPDDLTFRRYRRFGAGGAKLIWGEAAAVTNEARATPRQLLVSPQSAAGLKRIVCECRAAHREACGRDDNLVIGLQLTHSGRYSYPRPLIAVHDPILDPRTIADRTTGTVVDDSYPLLSDDDLSRLVNQFVAAAKIARDAGFQFVDVKQCHRYLLNELLGATTRPGKYGGAFENRTRLAREIINAIRSEVPNIAIATRINVYDSIPYRKQVDNVGEPCSHELPLRNYWGVSRNDHGVADLTEPIAWIREMVRLGVVLVNVSMGSPYTTPHVLRPFETPPPDGYETPEHPLFGVARHFDLTAAIQRAIPEIPIVGSGYSYLQEFLPQAGAANLRMGRCGFVGVGRATLSQPDFARQLQKTGRLDRKRICRTFSYCTALMRAKHNELGQFATGCPPFDKELYGPLWNEAKAKPEK